MNSIPDENRLYGENQSRKGGWDVLGKNGDCYLIRKTSLIGGYLNRNLKEVRKVRPENALKISV